MEAGEWGCLPAAGPPCDLYSSLCLRCPYGLHDLLRVDVLDGELVLCTARRYSHIFRDIVSGHGASGGLRRWQDFPHVRRPALEAHDGLPVPLPSGHRLRRLHAYQHHGHHVSGNDDGPLQDNHGDHRAILGVVCAIAFGWHDARTEGCSRAVLSLPCASPQASDPHETLALHSCNDCHCWSSALRLPLHRDVLHLVSGLEP
mmetsp:Transcript_41719/g.120523  ORF Transcript_41719/g.120523 Transcript_41719/m.120523 type:complete len:202 (+) Transcript_41719:945-1550(+)